MRPFKFLLALAIAVVVSIGAPPLTPAHSQGQTAQTETPQFLKNLKRAFSDFAARQKSIATGVETKYARTVIRYQTKHKPGTIIIDPKQHFLYYVLENGKAIRYGVGVGREGFGWHGTVYIGRKAEWPTWTPPPEMIARERKRGVILPASMEGGPDNPLGARALYLYKNGRDTIYRIHGSRESRTIGQDVSSGCFRMTNTDVIDLYKRAKVGAKVVVL